MNVTSLVDEKSSRSETLVEQFAADVLSGFDSHPKRLPSKYFYDDRGSELFQRITEQPEYFVTRSEIAVLKEVRSMLPSVIGEKELDVIELGPGNGEKAKLLMDGFLEAGTRINYYPVDISAKAMDLIRGRISETEGLTIHGLVSDYVEGLDYVRKLSPKPLLVLFLGSSIGNFLKPEREAFLSAVRKTLGAGDFLMVGFDLRKDPSAHVSSFNDAAGMTEQFNINLLHRINRELGGNADTSKFKYYSYFNPVLGAMESYLVSLVEQEVTIARLNRTFAFQAFEPILVEYSFKLRPNEIDALARTCGYSIRQNFSEPSGSFMDSLWQAQT